MNVSRPLPVADSLADLPTCAEITHAIFQRVAPGDARTQDALRASPFAALPLPLPSHGRH